MKQEFDIEDEWVSFEIHPETSAEGMSLDKLFPKASLEGMYERLKASGAPYGLKFAESQNPILSNSRLALEASEFARDAGHFHDFHKKMFEAYFGEGRNIGERNVISDIAASCGLDTEELGRALDEGRYRDRLEDGLAEGHQYGVSGTPTFIINDKYKVVGAQPLEVMRRALAEISERDSEAQ